MKISPRAADSFCRAPPDEILRILVYGPNEGLVSDRARACAEAVAGDLDDPFRVTVLEPAMLKDEPGRLRDEAAALALIGGRRAIRVRDTKDSIAKAFELCKDLPPGSNMVIAEAGNLGPRSPLRRFFEQDPLSAAVPCYQDDAETVDGVVAAFEASEGIRFDDDARHAIAERVGSDRRVIRAALDKIRTYLGEDAAGATVSHADVEACVGDASEGSTARVAAAAAGGAVDELSRELARAFYAGAQPISVLRATGRHLMRLHLVVAAIERGQTEASALSTLRPPLYPRERSAFRAVIGRWTAPMLQTAITIVLHAERDCKVSGAPPPSLCERALLRVAHAARAVRQT